MLLATILNFHSYFRIFTTGFSPWSLQEDAIESRNEYTGCNEFVCMFVDMLIFLMDSRDAIRFVIKIWFAYLTEQKKRNNLLSTFGRWRDWSIVRNVQTRRVLQSSFTEILQILDVSCIDLSYRNYMENVVDCQLHNFCAPYRYQFLNRISKCVSQILDFSSWKSVLYIYKIWYRMNNSNKCKAFEQKVSCRIFIWYF